MKRKLFILGVIFFILYSFNLFPSQIDNISNYYIYRIENIIIKKDFDKLKKELISLKQEKIPLNKKKIILLRIEGQLIDLIKKGKIKEAENILSSLKILFPDEWRIYNIETKIGFYKANISKIIKAGFKSIYLFYKNNKGVFFNSLFLSFIFSLFGVLIILTLFYSTKYALPFLSDLNLLDEGEDNLVIFKILGFIIFIFLPLLTFSGFFYIPFILSAVLYSYFSQQFKNHFKWLIGFIIISIPLLIIVNSINKIEKDKNFILVKKINSGFYLDNDLKEALTIWRKNKNPDIGAALIRRYYIDGFIVKAKELCEKFPETERYRKFKNFILGNIYYKLGFFNKAEASYRNVFQSNEKDEIINYNIAVLLMRLNEVEKANDFIKVSKNFAKKHGLKYEKLFEVAYYKEPSIFKLLKIEDYKTFLNNPFLIGIFAFLIIRILLSFIFTRIGRSSRCVICGKVIKRKSAQDRTEHCPECFNLFVIKDPMLSETRKIRYNEIEAKKRKSFFIYTLLSLFIPGFLLLELEKEGIFIVLNFFTLFIMLFYFFSSKISKISPLKSFPEGFLFVLIFLFIYFLIGILTFISGREEWV